jgi:hypothetical protein
VPEPRPVLRSAGNRRYPPEDFEDTAIAADTPPERRLKAEVKLVEALGSELIVHFLLDATTINSGDPDALEQGNGEGAALAVARFNPRSHVHANKPPTSPSPATTSTFSMLTPTNGSSECEENCGAPNSATALLVGTPSDVTGRSHLASRSRPQDSFARTVTRGSVSSPAAVEAEFAGGPLYAWTRGATGGCRRSHASAAHRRGRFGAAADLTCRRCRNPSVTSSSSARCDSLVCRRVAISDGVAQRP